MLALSNCLLVVDVNLTTSLEYVREVQAELCHFLLRAARRAIKRRPPPPPPPSFLGFGSTSAASPATLATIAASERLSLLLSHLTEVKHVAFQLESFLVARYYASCIPNESLLTEMLLTKRGGGAGRSSTLPSQPAAPPPSVASTSTYGFGGNFPSPSLHLKRDPNGYIHMPPLAPWRSESGEVDASYPAASVAPSGAVPPPAQYSSSPSDYQPQQDLSFFMPPAPQQQQQQQSHASTSVI